MNTYEVEKYEIYTTKLRVVAKSPADAINKVYSVESEGVDNSLEFIESAEDIGMPIEGNEDIADELRALGVDLRGDFIPSIRAVELIDGDDEETKVADAP